MTEPRSADREARAQELARAIARGTEDELLQIARLLVDADPATLFGPTEFQVRRLAHQIAAKAYQHSLAQKKTATTPPG